MYTTQDLAPFTLDLADGVEMNTTTSGDRVALQFAKRVGCCDQGYISGGAPFDTVEHGRVTGVRLSQCSQCGRQGTGYTVSKLHWVDLDDAEAAHETAQGLADAFADDLAADVDKARAKLSARLIVQANEAVTHCRSYLAAIAEGMDKDEADTEHLEANGIRLGTTAEYEGTYFNGRDTVTAWAWLPQSDTEYDYESVTVKL